MEKVAVYARVSTDRQEKEETIETQLMVVRDYCKANGYDATEYLDDGYSGITLDLEERPAGARRSSRLTRTTPNGLPISTRRWPACPPAMTPPCPGRWAPAPAWCSSAGSRGPAKRT